jgi:hypothetical protein
MTTEANMFRTLARTTLMLLAAGGAAWLTAAGNSIGMAVTNGGFQVDHAQVSGIATLFDGSSIETAKAHSKIRLNDGVVMRLASDARATVYHHKLILERGLGQIESAAGYDVEARSLHISTATKDGVARISVENGRNLQVEAARGDVRVTNSAGLLVAKIEEGRSLSFEPQTGGTATATHASGCLVAKAGKLILAERTANVILELQGAGLENQTGNRIEILGMAAGDLPTVPGASQVIQVTELKLIGRGGCGSVAKKLGGSAGAPAAGATGTSGAGGAAGAATATGIGVGTVAVIGGVASAAALGGLALAGSFSGSASTASR